MVRYYIANTTNKNQDVKSVGVLKFANTTKENQDVKSGGSEFYEHDKKNQHKEWGLVFGEHDKIKSTCKECGV